MMMKHKGFDGPTLRDLRRAGLPRAWAIVRPMPDKEALLMAQLEDLGWEVRRYTIDRRRSIGRCGRTIPYQQPAFPGYLFVRPPVGERNQLLYLPYVVSLLKVVVLDKVLHQVALELAERNRQTIEQAGARVWSRAPRKARFETSLGSFGELHALLSTGKPAIPVDAPRNKEDVNKAPDSVLWTAPLDRYLDLDANAGGRKCEAMVRRKNYFT
jgi:hypothetical protein